MILGSGMSPSYMDTFGLIVDNVSRSYADLSVAVSGLASSPYWIKDDDVKVHQSINSMRCYGCNKFFKQANGGYYEICPHCGAN